MATETRKHEMGVAAPRAARHSALEEFSRDERRTAVLLLSALVLAATFFALGLIVGRWTTQRTPATQPAATPVLQTPVSQQTLPPSSASASTTTAPDTRQRFSLLISTFKAPEEAEPLVKSLKQSGHAHVTLKPEGRGRQPTGFSILVGRFTREEAEAAARRLRASAQFKGKGIHIIEVASAASP